MRVKSLFKPFQRLKTSALLFKIDVEGAEWAILDDCGAHLPPSTMIFIETHAGADQLEEHYEQVFDGWVKEGVNAEPQ